MKTKIKIRKSKENVILTIPIDVFEDMFPAYPACKDESGHVESASTLSTLTGNPLEVQTPNVITPETTTSDPVQAPQRPEGSSPVQQ